MNKLSIIFKLSITTRFKKILINIRETKKTEKHIGMRETNLNIIQ
jgi:hypothetical protein